MHFNSW